MDSFSDESALVSYLSVVKHLTLHPLFSYTDPATLYVIEKNLFQTLWVYLNNTHKQKRRII